MSSIEAGSVVQLKSGGPKMTVTWAEEEYGKTYAYCEWFTQNREPWKKDGAKFPVTSLNLVEP